MFVEGTRRFSRLWSIRKRNKGVIGEVLDREGDWVAVDVDNELVMWHKDDCKRYENG